VANSKSGDVLLYEPGKNQIARIIKPNAQLRILDMKDIPILREVVEVTG
jgi:hypothetical protein